MKNYIIISLLLIVGCSKEIDIDKLQDRGGLKYEINSEEPFSGSVYKEYDSGEKEFKGYFKNGKPDGVWNGWYEDGQREFKTIWKDEKKVGLWTEWYSNGQKYQEETYKDGELISEKCWDRGGNERDCGYR